MIRTPQEIRVSSLVFSFMDKTPDCPPITPNVTATGAVVTVGGEVYEFSFNRGKICFASTRSADRLFSKTTIQMIEGLLEAYIHGVLKLDTIRCNVDVQEDDVTTTEDIETD